MFQKCCMSLISVLRIYHGAANTENCLLNDNDTHVTRRPEQNVCGEVLSFSAIWESGVTIKYQRLNFPSLFVSFNSNNSVWERCVRFVVDYFFFNHSTESAHGLFNRQIKNSSSSRRREIKLNFTTILCVLGPVRLPLLPLPGAFECYSVANATNSGFFMILFLFTFSVCDRYQRVESFFPTGKFGVWRSSDRAQTESSNVQNETQRKKRSI